MEIAPSTLMQGHSTLVAPFHPTSAAPICHAQANTPARELVAIQPEPEQGGRQPVGQGNGPRYAVVADIKFREQPGQPHRPVEPQ